MIELKLSPSHWYEIVKKGYSLDIIFLLKMIEEGYLIEESIGGGPKITNMEQTIIRKGLVTPEGALTLEGKSLLDFLSTEGKKLVKKKSEIDEITMFWKVFPATDTFEHKGKKFAGSRALRINKEGCRIKLKAILNTGEYTLDEILAAVEYDVLSKKEASIKEGTNKLKYMQNSLTYLNQLSFEPYIELIKQGNKIKESNQEFDGINI